MQVEMPLKSINLISKVLGIKTPKYSSVRLEQSKSENWNVEYILENKMHIFHRSGLKLAIISLRISLLIWIYNLPYNTSLHPVMWYWKRRFLMNNIIREQWSRGWAKSVTDTEIKLECEKKRQAFLKVSLMSTIKINTNITHTLYHKSMDKIYPCLHGSFQRASQC